VPIGGVPMEGVGLAVGGVKSGLPCEKEQHTFNNFIPVEKNTSSVYH
jgi:hypothetical protein